MKSVKNKDIIIQMPKFCHCGRPVFNSTTMLCDWHTPRKPIKKKFVSKTEVKRTPIKKVSKAQAKKVREYSKQRREAAEQVIKDEGVVLCEIRLEGCMNIATDWHHSEGRTGDKIIKSKGKWCCRSCHDFVTKNSRWAIEQGFSVSRLSKH